MAKREETIQFLNKELDTKSKKLRFKKVKEQRTFSSKLSDKVILKRRIKK